MRATSTRRTQGLGGRHRGTGSPAGMTRRQTAPPPELKVAQVRCPVCRNGARLNVRGFLREHRDLFGLKCYNRRPPTPD